MESMAAGMVAPIYRRWGWMTSPNRMLQIGRAGRKWAIMLSPGGTDGGGGKFLLGLALAGVSLYFFFDSVLVSTDGGGALSGLMRGGRGGRGGGMWNTTSMGIIFLPFFIGLVALFYDAKKRWAWIVTWIGLAIIVIEMLSRIRFIIQSKSSHLLIMMVVFAAGAGLMLQSYRDGRRERKAEQSAADKKNSKEDPEKVYVDRD